MGTGCELVNLWTGSALQEVWICRLQCRWAGQVPRHPTNKNLRQNPDSHKSSCTWWVRGHNLLLIQDCYSHIVYLNYNAPQQTWSSPYTRGIWQSRKNFEGAQWANMVLHTERKIQHLPSRGTTKRIWLVEKMTRRRSRTNGNGLQGILSAHGGQGQSWFVILESGFRSI